MRTRDVVIDRLAVGLVGLALLLGAAAVLCYRWGFAPVHDAIARFHHPATAEWTDQPWWPWALAAVALVAAFKGLWILAASFASRSAHPVVLPGSGDGGRLTVELAPIAAASAQAMEHVPSVVDARHRARVDRGVPGITLDVDCEPSADLGVLAETARANAVALDRAVADSPVGQRMLVRVVRPRGK